MILPSLDTLLAEMATDIEQATGVQPTTSASDDDVLWRPLPAERGRGIQCPDGVTRSPQELAVLTCADELGFGGGLGGGKALDVETPIPSPSGWRRMGDLMVGDEVFDETGRPCRVTFATGVMENHETYTVAFDDGDVIVSDADHLWLTMSHAERRAAARRSTAARAARRAKRLLAGPRLSGRKSARFSAPLAARNRTRLYKLLSTPSGTVRTTREISSSVRCGNSLNHHIALPSPIQLSDAALPVDPYVLGVWLGDGTSACACVTTADQFVLDELRRLGHDVWQSRSRAGSYSWRVSDLRHRLLALGLIGAKRVPDAYLWASVSQRLALLQGLMDSAGEVGTDGGCAFSNTNEGLADAVVHLLWSFGVKAHKSGPARVVFRGRECASCWSVRFTTTLPACRLPRKASRLPATIRPTQRIRYIESVEPCPTRPVRCIQVDSPSRLYLAGRSFTPTHNTNLLIGLAVTQHRSSVIFRSEFTQLRGADGIWEQSVAMIGARGVPNRSVYAWHDLPGGRTLEFAGVRTLDQAVRKWKGRPHDMKGFDEVTEIPEAVFRFMLGWLRTSHTEQRTRVVATFNPPLNEEGQWVNRYWAPWLDPHHPNPAKPGELRWFVVDDGKDREVPGPAWGPKRAPTVKVKMLNGERWVKPRSRTFIPSSVEDNPYYLRTGYADVLDALPEEMQRLRGGDFHAAMPDDPWQVIPTAWVKLAQARWRHDGADGPLTAVGADPSRGGQDEFVVAPRYGAWIAPLRAYMAKEAPDGHAGAMLISAALNGDNAPVHVDVGGIGSAVFDALRLLRINVLALNGAEKSRARDKSGRLGFVNKRAEWHWKMREALDPASGQDIAIPPDPQLRADLCAPRWRLSVRGIQIEEKAEIQKRIGRSPDRGEAVIYVCADPSGGPLDLLFESPPDVDDLASRVAALKAQLGV